jgi:hypothetical protein
MLYRCVLCAVVTCVLFSSEAVAQDDNGRILDEAQLRNGRSYTGVIHRTSGLSRRSGKRKLGPIIDRPTLRANGLEICLAQPNGLGG